MRDLIKGRAFLILSHYGHVKVPMVELWLRHMHKVPSGSLGYVRDDTHSIGWETGATAPLLTISLRVCSVCSWYSMDTFHCECWTGRMEGSVLMVCILDMLPVVSKEPGNAHFKVTMSWATAVEEGVKSHLGFNGFKSWFWLCGGWTGLVDLGSW